MSLLSVSAAAKQAGVDRKTVQRYLKAGTLKWHGEITHGQHAKGIELGELMRIVGGTGRDGKLRSARKPIGLRLQAFLKKQGLDPRAVLESLIRAFRGGMDADLGAYCIERLVQEDALFIRLVMEGANPALELRTEQLRVYAAAKVREYAAIRDGDPDMEQRPHSISGDFGAGLALLFRLWRIAPPHVEPSIVVDLEKKTADIGLVPRWCMDAPPGLLPELGGKWSLYRIREGDSYASVLPVVRAIAQATLFSTEPGAQEKLTLLPLLIMVGGEEASASWSESAGEADTLAYLTGTLGINKAAAKRFGRYWSVLKADALTEDRKHTVQLTGDPDHDEAMESLMIQPEDLASLSRPSDETLCKAMGISRSTAQRWIQSR